MTPPGPGRGGPGGQLSQQAVVSAPLDGRFGQLLEIPKLLAGRQPKPAHPGEVMVDQIAAQDLRLHVGSRLTLMIPVAILAANAIAFRPGRLSVRLNTADVLGAE